MLAPRPLTVSRPAVRPCEGKARSRESRIVRPGAGRDGGTGRQSTRTSGRRSQSLSDALRQTAVPNLVDAARGLPCPLLFSTRMPLPPPRSDEHRVGTERVHPGRPVWLPYLKQKKQKL